MIQTDLLTDSIAALTTLQHKPAEWSVWSLCADGYYLMLPLLALLLVVVYVFIERAVFVGQACQTDNAFMQRITDYVHENEVESAVNLCRKTASPVSLTVQRGIDRLGHPETEIIATMEMGARMELSKLQSGMQWLTFASYGAPLIGLLGASLGLARKMFDASFSIETLSALSTPIVTFIAGITVGLAAWIAAQYLTSRIKAARVNLLSTIERFMNILNTPAA